VSRGGVQIVLELCGSMSNHSKHARALRQVVSVLCSGAREVAGGLAVANCTGLEPLGTERLPPAA